jgi:IS30 family transposase
MTYTHLSQDERYQIAILAKANHDQSTIADLLNRHKSTVSSELRRNRGLRGNRPKQAQTIALNRLTNCANGPRIAQTTWNFVNDKLG